MRVEDGRTVNAWRGRSPLFVVLLLGMVGFTVWLATLAPGSYVWTATTPALAIFLWLVLFDPSMTLIISDQEIVYCTLSRERIIPKDEISLVEVDTRGDIGDEEAVIVLRSGKKLRLNRYAFSHGEALIEALERHGYEVKAER
ncbi:hypothetical protein [Parvularcula maris]|uniref:PH domain-containing protein n=1 Tax=Parvularcula maris TaxID=2965077 RepID=A0A9X2LAM7_9PROT|nr:hypothetical protein [Parvularcula maris]MCQ8186215.1 hypothetical protein [Parvularcula maris]